VSVKRRKFTAKAKVKILAFYAQNGFSATEKKFRIVGSVFNRWRREASQSKPAKPNGATRPPSVSMEAIVYLRHAKRAWDAGNPKKGELFARLALVSLEEK
jgi:transposase-like protein